MTTLALDAFSDAVHCEPTVQAERVAPVPVDAPGRMSVRNIGRAAGIEFATDPGAPGRRGQRAQAAAFDQGRPARAPNETRALALPFIGGPRDIDHTTERVCMAIVISSSGANA